MIDSPTHLVRPTRTFPFISIPTGDSRSPIEVNLVAQLGIGAGSPLIFGAAARQMHHPRYIDALDEPSAKLGDMNPAHGDHTSLYSFVVGAAGHPFHAHDGRRMFTAISGSGGAQLRFSSLTHKVIEQDPAKFSQSLHLINIPPDCLFSVRFDGGIWHQFASLDPASGHPALFALSCHPNELGGLRDGELKAQVERNEGSIPLLTTVLPSRAQIAADQALADPSRLRSTALYLQPPSAGWRNVLCAGVRAPWGRLRSIRSRLPTTGSLKSSIPGLVVEKLPSPPVDSLLHRHFSTQPIHHDDSFSCTLADPVLNNRTAGDILDTLLESFDSKPPATITALMMVRNALVAPLGLRRSRLGCPVSSLRNTSSPERFAGRHPVLAQEVSANGCVAQVLLGADDQHLSFRTCVSIHLLANQRVAFGLSSRVVCRNQFGRFYMAIIKRAHETYVSPKLLRTAIAAVTTADQQFRQQATANTTPLILNQPFAAQSPEQCRQ